MNQSNVEFLETANAIGSRLCRDAMWDKDRCNWLGDSMEYISNTWTVAHRACGTDLYGGTAGIALFLGQLYATTHDRIHRITAEGAARQALSQLHQISIPGGGGFYSGSIGLAYALIKLGQVFNEEYFTNKAMEIIKDVSNDDIEKQGLDVTAGSAGAIPALINIYKRYSQDFILDLAIRHGEHLMATARKNDDKGWSWDTLQMGNQHALTGFSHGTAGIAWALLELFQTTRQEQFSTAAEHAFQYEKSWFSAEHGNWPDLRSLYDRTLGDGKTLTYMLAWCHGAPGIGLSRLRAYAITGDIAYRDEAEIAVRTTANSLRQALQWGQGNYSLCHGLAGNAELLIYASQLLETAEYRMLAEQVGNFGIAYYERNRAPWPCGVLDGGETPGLMLGLAGIGHFYLRLYDPIATPPVVIVLPD